MVEGKGVGRIIFPIQFQFDPWNWFVFFSFTDALLRLTLFLVHHQDNIISLVLRLSIVGCGFAVADQSTVEGSRAH